MVSIYLTHFVQPEKMKHTAEHNVGLRLLSQALNDHFQIQIPSEQLDDQMEKNSYGKPSLAAYPEVHFNISHGSDLAVCAVSDHCIGVDVEGIHDFHDTILRKVLTEDEKAFFHQMSTDEATKREWFFRFWTLKESRIKQAGMGLSMSLTGFSFTFDLTKDPYQIQCSDPDLFFHQYKLDAADSSYLLSLCTTVENETVELIWV